MNNVHGNIDKLLDSGNVIQGLLNSSIHESIGRSISDADINLANISSQHDNILAFDNFSSLLGEADTVFQNLCYLTNHIQSSTYTLLEYSLANGDFDLDQVFQRVDSNKISSFLSLLLDSSNLSLKQVTSHESIVDLLLSRKYRKDGYETILNQIISSIPNDRERTVACALFMTMVFPHMPYFFAGGHSANGVVKEGIDYRWGEPTLQKNGDHTGETLPYSLDCSSFMTWCFKNAKTGGYDDWTVKSFVKNGSEATFDLKDGSNSQEIFNEIKIGDLAVNSDNSHIGMVVKVDPLHHQVVVAHCSSSGGGMNLTALDVFDDHTTIIDDSCDRDPSTSSIDYFTKFIHVDYENKKNKA